uniref:Uncharacterized protein n=1 Tax=Pipistrellus kuhlii TaxID=59472 RepID=A0A7J7ZKG9_PIPKU|nr:hypothetical protein mPipKuh1_009655 [Pipistrellus kuhlii]
MNHHPSQEDSAARTSSSVPLLPHVPRCSRTVSELSPVPQPSDLVTFCGGCFSFSRVPHRKGEGFSSLTSGSSLLSHSGTLGSPLQTPWATSVFSAPSCVWCHRKALKIASLERPVRMLHGGILVHQSLLVSNVLVRQSLLVSNMSWCVNLSLSLTCPGVSISPCLLHVLVCQSLLVSYMSWYVNLSLSLTCPGASISPCL